MKRILTLILTAGLLLGAATGASAMEFKAQGEWIFGFGMVDTRYATRVGGVKQHEGDNFAALQRVRLQLEAKASDYLSGTVYFEIGDTAWGHAESGGTLGADSDIIQVKHAYLDWTPNAQLKVRMGIQAVILPNVAGGSGVMDDDMAGIVLDYAFNDMVSLTAVWVRPYNDNYTNDPTDNRFNPDNYLDNIDLFALALPITGDGWKITTWVMFGIAGVNATGYAAPPSPSDTGFMGGMNTIQRAYRLTNDMPAGVPDDNYRRNSAGYTSMFWVGLPIAITAFDPWNFEFDINYGSMTSTGRYDAFRVDTGTAVRARNQRAGWLLKGLVEYKLDWATPGLFFWYGSGDQTNPRNGSQRMPTFSACGNFTSFMGDGNERGWSIHNSSWSKNGFDQMLSYSGTWGLGFQLKSMSFLEGLSHTFRVAYWGGTNSPSMAKYLPANGATLMQSNAGFYLTTNDYLLEFNLDSTYTIYENLTATLELGYIVNGVDKGTWNRGYRNNPALPAEFGRISIGDAYKVALVFKYSF